MSILSVVLANPTLLVVVIGVSFGAVVWFVFIRSDSGKKEQSPKPYKPASPEKEDQKKEKPATPDRRTLLLRTPLVDLRPSERPVAHRGAGDEAGPIMTPRTLASRGALSLSGHNPLSGGPLTPRRAGTHPTRSPLGALRLAPSPKHSSVVAHLAMQPRACASPPSTPPPHRRRA